ncbi:chloride channel protein (voltage gated) [Legionella lansingensis]|uniref:Chloride channel protein (Voltage gated) n=1 Tax=Legionella lansingensis TaxID=45067 RepID=A0A0W0VLF9_9GAMM|nr:chloride channel protein [Legionella lansingensis]KTD20971.1 chloride channel protein (voltage gated) [Legionella lansingensis]SNV44639.1 chloride channel protein (voltage gated) [Legionella lansingensis]
MESVRTENQLFQSSKASLALVIVLVGVGSGFLGMCLALLLHYLQHIAYGYSPLHIISNETFLEGVRASSPERRITILFLCGLIAGIGWWALYSFGKPLVSIALAIKSGKPMPPLSTFIHAFLQIITIALGSPLGREVAPREVSSVYASWLSAKAGLSPEESKIMLACGAGAGLAAVYNVPLGGAVFVLEVLLCTYNWTILLFALSSSAIAVLVSWWGLGNESIYQIPDISLNASLIICSIIASPVLGFFAFWFIQIATVQRSKAIHSWHMIFSCLLNFLILGLFSVYFPSLLGNGKSPAEMEFDQSVGIGLSILLFLLRSIFVWTSLRVGAQGGLLTPSLANGALLGAILGGIWNLCLPSVPIHAFAIIGATAFLAAAQKMPLTAIILIFEFTRMNFVFLIPIMLAVSGSVAMCQLTKNYYIKYKV